MEGIDGECPGTVFNPSPVLPQRIFFDCVIKFPSTVQLLIFHAFPHVCVPVFLPLEIKTAQQADGRSQPRCTACKGTSLALQAGERWEEPLPLPVGGYKVAFMELLQR